MNGPVPAPGFHDREDGRPSLRTTNFSLVELLVVVAVLLLLASLLMPALVRMIEGTRRTKCASNQKQMYLASVAYAEDFADCLPAQDFGTSYGLYQNYVHLTKPYSPIRYWMVAYAGVDKWIGSVYGNTVDPLGAPGNWNGPIPARRNHVVYCPSVDAYAVNPTGNSYLSYYFNGFGLYYSGWWRLGPGQYQFVGTTKMRRLAEGLQTANGRFPFQIFGDRNEFYPTPSNQPGYRLNHNEKGGNFTDATGSTKWIDDNPAWQLGYGSGGWWGGVFRQCAVNMAVQGGVTPQQAVWVNSTYLAGTAALYRSLGYNPDAPVVSFPDAASSPYGY